MEINGKIVAIMPEQVISDKFCKREIVIETSGEYPQQIVCQAVQDRCSMLDKYQVGQKVTAHINLRGKKYTNKTTGADAWFNSVEVWKIDAEPVSSSVSSDDLDF
jgi:single-strand DNA-binding protein